MGVVRVKLVCMNGGGASPGGEDTHFLPSEDDPLETYVLLHLSEGRYIFSDNLNQYDPEEVQALAKLTMESSSSFSVVLESLVDAVYIEPAASPKLAGLLYPDRISVPPSTDTQKHYFHLRPDDIIDLREDGVKIRVMAEIANSTDGMEPSPDSNIVVADRFQAEVQVKSSNANSDQDGDHNGMDDETDSSDDDLDQTDSELPARALPIGEVTPLTIRRIDQTIMETPHATTLAKNDTALLPGEDVAPYSTTPKRFTSDTVILEPRHSASPSIRVPVKRTAHAHSSNNGALDHKDVKQPSTPSELDGEADQTRIAGTDSGSRTHTTTSQQTSRLPDRNAMKEVEQDVKGTEGNAQDSPDPAATSEPLQPYQIARAVVSSVMAGSGKRKLSDIDLNEETFSSSSKKHKSDSRKVVEEQRGEDSTKMQSKQVEEDENGVDDSLSIEKSSKEQSDAENEDPEEYAKPAKRGKKGKAAKPKAATRRTTNRTASVNSEQSNASPTVVLAGQRSSNRQSMASNSPPSSAVSSALADGNPSILLSNDSPLRKGPAAAFLKSQRAPIIDDVKSRRSHFVCVLKGDKLTTTAKVLRSLALGKLVVKEDWITKSQKAKELLEPVEFVHPDLKSTMNFDRHTIFQHTNLFFTKALAKTYGKGWKNIQELAKEAGANHVEEGDSASFGTFLQGRIDVICFGAKENDAEVGRLKNSHRVNVYHKNLLTQRILKGQLDIDNEEHLL